MNPPQVKTFVIDLFCGAGGTSTAIFQSNTNIEVVACINHDKNAIISHASNYPNCQHFIEDIRTIGMGPLIDIVTKLRREYPNCKIALWASLECTNHSKAKGGQSRDADSRSLADHLFRYIDTLNVDFVWIENVQEFMEWGPLRIKEGAKSTNKKCELLVDKKGAYIMFPVKEQKGIFYDKWINKLKSRHFHYEYKILCSADYGGILVWVVADQTKNGSESGTSFKQALQFMADGWRLFDTMIWKKTNPMPGTKQRYTDEFEYMFVFSKGKPKIMKY